MFSRKSDYGLRALIYLTEHGVSGPVTLNEIAEKTGVPKAFLSKILQQLARSSIVKSLKGPSGGFTLARDPATLTVRDVVREIDGPLRMFECFSNGNDCCHYGDCKILSVFERVGQEMERVLGEITLGECVNARPRAAVKVAAKR